MSDDAESVPLEHPVLVFDGVCNLCNGLVQWIIERDPDGRFRFAALQSDAGQRLLEAYDLPTEDFDTVVLLDGENCYTKSTAALETLKELGVPYSLLYPAVVVPRFLRDRVYDFVAEHRYGWFGRRDACMMPDEDLESRFLE